MENYIVFILISLTLDFVLFLSLKKLYKLESSNICIVLLQILNVTAGVIYLVLELKFYQFIIIKLVSNLLICLLITKSYKLSDFSLLYFSSLALMFSYYGFSKFMTALARAVIFQIFHKNLSIICDFVIIFAIICYIFAFFKLINILSKNKNLNSFLRKVSFFAFGKHIEIIGLLDSGNVLYDTKTKLPVIVIDVCALKKFLPKENYINITNCNYKNFPVSHYLNVVTVSDKTFDMPIVDIKFASIYCGTEKRNIKCVLGIVNHRFENSNRYDCLLHRDFI